MANLPDFKDIGAAAGKLFGDIKKSISEIVEDYKKKQPKPEEPVSDSSTTEQPKPSDGTVSKQETTTSTPETSTSSEAPPASTENAEKPDDEETK